MAENKKPPTLRSIGDNLVKCENGAILDGDLPDKIVKVSDTVHRFYYGSRIFQLSYDYDKATGTKSNIKIEEIKEEE